MVLDSDWLLSLNARFLLVESLRLPKNQKNQEPCHSITILQYTTKHNYNHLIRENDITSKIQPKFKMSQKLGHNI